MKNRRVSYFTRALIVLTSTPLLVLGSIGVSTSASAQPMVATAASLTLVPTAVGPVAKSSHCGERAYWVSNGSAHDKRLKLRIWHYVDVDKATHYCTKIYKVKPKKNRTTIGLDTETFFGKGPSVRSKGSSVYIRVLVPQYSTSYVRARYGKIIYDWIALYG